MRELLALHPSLCSVLWWASTPTLWTLAHEDQYLNLASELPWSYKGGPFFGFFLLDFCSLSYEVKYGTAPFTFKTVVRTTG